MNDISASDKTGVVDDEVESARETVLLSRLLCKVLRLGVDELEGVEQLEGGPEPVLGLL